MESLPSPQGPVRDDSEQRDELGRFLSSYNEPKERTEPELGEKFNSVKVKRAGKALPLMRAATSSLAVLHRKIETLTLTPVVTDSPRLAGLRHWQGDHLGPLVGMAYKPETVTKFTRELKYAEASWPLMHGAMAFWLGREKVVDGPLEGAALVYADTAVKPVWTTHFSRCAKVTGNGRVMPATSTVFLHTGTGTPVLYRSLSGHASLPAEVLDLLGSYERVAGKGTVRRLVVMDREAHAVWVMKALDKRDWDYIIPLRTSVTGPSARFSDLTPWAPYQEEGDEVCGGSLLLNDSKDRKNPLPVRVVGRKRRRTGKVAWYATNTSPAEIPDSRVLEAYFDRWPLQEHRFRDGNGRVHLHSHHGYGKLKVDNIGVLDRNEKLQGRLRRVEQQLAGDSEEVIELEQDVEDHEGAVAKVDVRVGELREELDAAINSGNRRAIRRSYDLLSTLEEGGRTMRDTAGELTDKLAETRRCVHEAELQREKLQGEKARLEGWRKVFTIDTELDQIMTAFKVTFVNLCAVLMTCYFGGHRLQLDTLIRGVLTLPGERVLSRHTETIRIYRRDRDRELMPLVEEACRLLTAKGLVRAKRRLCFELVDPPPAVVRRRTTPGDDTA